MQDEPHCDNSKETYRKRADTAPERNGIRFGVREKPSWIDAGVRIKAREEGEGIILNRQRKIRGSKIIIHIIANKSKNV